MRYNNSGNNAWLFQKAYYNGFDWNRKEQEPYAPNFFKDRLEWIKSVRLVKQESELAIPVVRLKTTYPGLVTGVGITHESKSKGELMLGFEFDYTSGMPVIRGHSVKGAIRSAFPQHHRKEVMFKYEKAYQVFCWLHDIPEFTKKGLAEFKESKSKYDEIVSYENEIFDGKINGSLISNYTQDVFFDSYIIKASQFPATRDQFLGDDSITPHAKRGMSYEQSMLTNPIPLPFLKILPGVEIEFRFKFNDNGLLNVDQKRSLFTSILTNQGVGAKTNVGYGQLEPI